MRIEHVAIVGAGFSGTLQAINLLHQRMGQALAVGVGQRVAGHIDDQRGMLGHWGAFSTTTKLAA